MPCNKQLTDRVTRSVLEIRSPHFYARPSQARAARKRSGFVFPSRDRVPRLVNRYYKMTLCGLFQNNESISNRPYQTNFPTEGGGEYITAFQSLSTDIAGGCYDHGNAISWEDFLNGSDLISFDTSADLSPKAYFDSIDKGEFKLELQFGSALTHAVNIIVHAEFNLIEINGSRDVIHKFAE